MMSSPIYWAFVAAITVAFAVVDVLALSRRDLGRPQAIAVGFYLAAWGLVLGLSLPIAPLGSLWWVFPAIVRISVAAIVGGGTFLSLLFDVEQAVVHPESAHAPPPPPRRKLTETELHEAEDYDAKWQAEDRKRNREREQREALELEERHRHAHAAHGDADDRSAK